MATMTFGFWCHRDPNGQFPVPRAGDIVNASKSRTLQVVSDARAYLRLFLSTGEFDDPHRLHFFVECIGDTSNTIVPDDRMLPDRLRIITPLNLGQVFLPIEHLVSSRPLPPVDYGLIARSEAGFHRMNFDDLGRLHSHDGMPSAVRDRFDEDKEEENYQTVHWHDHGLRRHPLVPYQPAEYCSEGVFSWFLGPACYEAFSWNPYDDETTYDFCMAIEYSFEKRRQAETTIMDWRNSETCRDLFAFHGNSYVNWPMANWSAYAHE